MLSGPSVCRVGDDYFLVTSTFEYFPGLPLVTVEGRILDPAAARAFVGVGLGLYATSNGQLTTSLAQADWFEYRPA